MLTLISELFLNAWKAIAIAGSAVAVLYLWPDIRDLPSAYGYTWGRIMPDREALAYILLGIALAWIIWIDVRPTVHQYMAERTARLSPEMESVRGALRINFPPALGIDVSADGLHMTRAQVKLNIYNGGHRPITYTVHKFAGSIDGHELKDVSAPNSGGEMIPNEPRTYNGDNAHVRIGAGRFSGEIAWDISYGLDGDEPFRVKRRVEFAGVYNPQNRRGENINWTWAPIEDEDPGPQSPPDTEERTQP